MRYYKWCFVSSDKFQFHCIVCFPSDPHTFASKTSDQKSLWIYWLQTDEQNKYIKNTQKCTHNKCESAHKCPCVQTNLHTHAHTHAFTHLHTNINTYTNTPLPSHTHTHTHSLTHSTSHSYKPILIKTHNWVQHNWYKTLLHLQNECGIEGTKCHWTQWEVVRMSPIHILSVILDKRRNTWNKQEEQTFKWSIFTILSRLLCSHQSSPQIIDQLKRFGQFILQWSLIKVIQNRTQQFSLILISLYHVSLKLMNKHLSTSQYFTNYEATCDIRASTSSFLAQPLSKFRSQAGLEFSGCSMWHSLEPDLRGSLLIPFLLQSQERAQRQLACLCQLASVSHRTCERSLHRAPCEFPALHGVSTLPLNGQGQHSWWSPDSIWTEVLKQALPVLISLLPG